MLPRAAPGDRCPRTSACRGRRSARRTRRAARPPPAGRRAARASPARRGHAGRRPRRAPAAGETRDHLIVDRRAVDEDQLLQQPAARHQRALPFRRQAGQREHVGIDPESDRFAERDAVVAWPSTWRRIRDSPSRTGPRAARRGTGCRRGGPSARRWRSASRRSGSHRSPRCGRPGWPPDRSSGCPGRDRNRR